jgi:hypothetical protein
VQEDILESIDRKLTALIPLTARQLLDGETTGIELVLRRAGLGTSDIASILSKSQRTVQLALKEQGYKE